MRLLPLATGLLLTGCFAPSLPVTVSSEPPGALVLVDGVPSGFSTPCRLTLRAKAQRLDLELPGYQPATRWLTRGGEFGFLLWREFSVAPRVWHFPLWMNYQDLAVPLMNNYPLQPGRIFVRMQHAGDE